MERTFSVRKLFALRFVSSLPVFVSAAAAKSGVSASDPELDIGESEVSQPSWHESNAPTVMVALTTLWVRTHVRLITCQRR